MGRLSDILRQQGKLNDVQSAWNSTAAAGEFDVLPTGQYVADIIKGEAIESRSKQTPGFRLTFQVAEGPLAGSRFWHDCWFTDNAMAQTKRDLEKLGVTDLRQLEQPLPAVFRCKAKLTIRRDDNGNESNNVRRFDVIGIIQPEADPFAPKPAPGSGAGDTGISGDSSAMESL